MYKKIIIAISALLFSLLVFAGSTYCFLVSESSEPFTVSMPQIKTDLSFQLSGNRGIPGETIVLSEDTVIQKGNGSADYIFKLTYEVMYKADGEEDLDYITDLRLDTSTLTKAVNYDRQTCTVIYYGKHMGEGDIYPGVLLADFDVVKNPLMGKEFDISASLEACQMTEDAVRDIFGIDSQIEDGKYADLFN